MTRPFEGIRTIDVTHVLAGPFAAYQLAVLGAEVIKVEHPDEPDQTRDSGSDRTRAAFKFADGGPSIETPPPVLGADTERVLAEYGYDADRIAAFRRAKVI